MKISRHRRDRIDHLLSGSRAAHAVRERQSEIEAGLREAKCKVWPVARVARLFGVSVRLLWQWIETGMIATYRRPTPHHRKGITAAAIREFLGCLERQGLCVRPRRQCRRPAWEKCQQAFRALAEDELLTPREFAAHAGVSVATVWRATRTGNLPALWQTRRLRRICRKPHIHKKKSLTPKSRGSA